MCAASIGADFGGRVEGEGEAGHRRVDALTFGVGGTAFGAKALVAVWRAEAGEALGAEVVVIGRTEASPGLTAFGLEVFGGADPRTAASGETFVIDPKAGGRGAVGLTANARTSDGDTQEVFSRTLLGFFARLHADAGLGGVEVDAAKVASTKFFLRGVFGFTLLAFGETGFIDFSVAVIVAPVANFDRGKTDAIGRPAVAFGGEATPLGAGFASLALAVSGTEGAATILEADQGTRAVALLPTTPPQKIGR